MTGAFDSNAFDNGGFYTTSNAPAPAPGGGGGGGGGGVRRVPPHSFYAEPTFIPQQRRPKEEDEALLLAVLH